MFGKRLRAIRKASDITQDEIADALKLDRTTIAKYENEDRLPDMQTVIAIADYFNISIDYLVGRKKDAKDKMAAAIIKRLEKHNILGDDEEFNNKIMKNCVNLVDIYLSGINIISGKSKGSDR